MNGGESWHSINTGLIGMISRIWALTIDPVTPTTLYAGTDDGVFKSTDGGENWRAVNTGIPNDAGAYALSIDPITPTTLYAAIGGLDLPNDSGLFKSTDGGGNWVKLNTAMIGTRVTTLVIDPATPAILYAGTDRKGIFKSADGGENWFAVNAGLNGSWVYALLIDPMTPATLYVGTNGQGVFALQLIK